MDNNDIKLELKPKFNFIYELGMPTGRKIKNALITIVIITIISVLVSFVPDTVDASTDSLISFNLFEYKNVIQLVALIAGIISVLILVFRIVIQVMQYNRTKFTFYSDRVTYDDTFLNQNRKTLMYANIKEVEIRRYIWDRINKTGMVILYTNAEKNYSSGLIIHSILDIKKYYDEINRLVHFKENVPNSINDIETNNESSVKSEEEKKFLDDLKND